MRRAVEICIEVIEIKGGWVGIDAIGIVREQCCPSVLMSRTGKGS